MSLKSVSVTPKSEREIFAAALRCSDPEERRRLLDSECGSDAALREAVEALLAESSGIGDFLEKPAVRDTRVTESCGTIKGHDLVGEELGDQIGPYELIDLIGEGGGGSVYLARQSDPVQRTVAFKILKLGMDTRSVIARFEAERQTLAMMEHPNIARVIDAGATAEGRPYFVMEYVPGESITDYCDVNNLTIEERLSIFIKVCRGVEHAHQKGIIHRDLKPSNILVTEQDGQAVPKIIDFGVAKAIDPRESDNPALTLIASVIGTLAYMSPEQAGRGARDIDTRSDVYSLGVLLHELLTGCTPLEAQKVKTTRIDEVRQSFEERVPMRPSAVLRNASDEERRMIEFHCETTMERLVSALRGDLDWVVMKCLDRDRARRFGSASDLAGDLERYLAGEPVTARPPSATYRLGKFAGRHRAAVVSCALLLLTLIAAAVVSMGLAVRATGAEQDMRIAHQMQTSLRSVAERDRESAVRSATAAHLQQYVADINLSHHALSDGNIAKALHLLDRHHSGTGRERDYRGFEWRYLAGECLGDQHTSLPLQDGSIESLAFSPDSELLAVGTRGELSVWSLKDDKLVLALPHGASSLAFFPDGDRLVAGGRGGIGVYDLDSGAVLWERRTSGGAMALSPDGSLLAISGRYGVSVWETADWTRRRQLPRCFGPLAFAPDGQVLATGTREGVTLWPLTGGVGEVVLEESPTATRGPFPGQKSLTFSSDGRFVLAAQNMKPTDHGYYMGIWDARSGKEVAMLPGSAGEDGHAGIISAASFGAGGSLLATSSWDHTVRLWDFETRRAGRALHGHRAEVWSVALSPDGRSIASGGKNGEVKIWPVAPQSRSDRIPGRWIPLEYSSDGNYLAAHNREGTLSIFNLRSGEAVHSLTLSSTDSRFSRYAVSLSQNLNVLAEGLRDGVVRIRNLEQETETTIRTGSRRLESVSLSPRADSLVTGGWGEKLQWWDLRAPSEQPVSIPGMRALFSADGQTLVTVSSDGAARVWDTVSRRERVKIADGAKSFGSRLALSPDGKTVAMTHGFDDFENAISLWDTTSGKKLGTLRGHKQGIWSIAFSSDGRTLASSSGGGTLRLWNVESRRELLTIREPGRNLTDLRFSPDGQYLVSSSPSFARKAELRFFRAPFADGVGLSPAASRDEPVRSQQTDPR